MIDPANYAALKSSGAIVSVSKEEDTITIASKAFDSNTGAALANEIDTFSAASLASQVSGYQNSLTAINGVVSSIQALLADAA